MEVTDRALNSSHGVLAHYANFNEVFVLVRLGFLRWVGKKWDGTEPIPPLINGSQGAPPINGSQGAPPT
jgi:hypothetical protein